MRRLASFVMLVTALGCRGRSVTPTPGVDPPLIVADSVRQVLLHAGREVVADVSTAEDTAAMCISFAHDNARYRLEPDELHALSIVVHGRRPLLHRPACPRTYASMVLIVDDQGHPRNLAPPGYVDPRYVELVLPVRWESEQAIVTVRVTHGTGTMTSECRVARAAASPATSCRPIKFEIS